MNRSMTSRAVPNILSIAGVDPSGGAGVLADIKAISALGGYACAVVTALTPTEPEPAPDGQESTVAVQATFLEPQA